MWITQLFLAAGTVHSLKGESALLQVATCVGRHDLLDDAVPANASLETLTAAVAALLPAGTELTIHSSNGGNVSNPPGNVSNPPSPNPSPTPSPYVTLSDAAFSLNGNQDFCSVTDGVLKVDPKQQYHGGYDSGPTCNLADSKGLITIGVGQTLELSFKLRFNQDLGYFRGKWDQIDNIPQGGIGTTSVASNYGVNASTVQCYGGGDCVGYGVHQIVRGGYGGKNIYYNHAPPAGSMAGITADATPDPGVWRDWYIKYELVDGASIGYPNNGYRLFAAEWKVGSFDLGNVTNGQLTVNHGGWVLRNAVVSFQFFSPASTMEVKDLAYNLSKTQ